MQTFDAHRWLAARYRDSHWPEEGWTELGCPENAAFDVLDDFELGDGVAGLEPYTIEFDRLHPPPCWLTDILCVRTYPISGWDDYTGVLVDVMDSEPYDTFTVNLEGGDIGHADTTLYLTRLVPLSGWDDFTGVAIDSADGDDVFTVNLEGGDLGHETTSLILTGSMTPYGGLDTFDGFTVESWTGAGEENGSAGGEPATTNDVLAPNEFTTGVYAQAT
jgi:hypothetical protein